MKDAPHVAEFTKLEPVSVERVDKFAELSRGQQVEILAALRARSVEDNLELAAFGIVIPIVVSLSIGLVGINRLTGPAWANWIAIGVASFLVAGSIMLVLSVLVLPRESRRKNALTWLAAYEDEIARRRSMPGREGRMWRRSH